jgi:hypothetical protein
MRFRLSLEELKSKVDIALKNDDLFADLKAAKIELKLSIGGTPRVSYNWKKPSFFQKIKPWFFGIFIPIFYVVFGIYFLSYPFTPLHLKLVQFAVFFIGMIVALNLVFIPSVKSKKDAFILKMPSHSFSYLLPFYMEKSLLHELQHIRQGVGGSTPSEKEANKIAKELLPIFLAKVKKGKPD